MIQVDFAMNLGAPPVPALPLGSAGGAAYLRAAVREPGHDRQHLGRSRGQVQGDQGGRTQRCLQSEAIHEGTEVPWRI